MRSNCSFPANFCLPAIFFSFILGEFRDKTESLSPIICRKFGAVRGKIAISYPYFFNPRVATRYVDLGLPVQHAELKIICHQWSKLNRAYWKNNDMKVISYHSWTKLIIAGLYRYNVDITVLSVAVWRDGNIFSIFIYFITCLEVTISYRGLRIEIIFK